MVESRFAQVLHREIAALRHAAILRGDGWLSAPFLKPQACFVVTFLDFRRDGAKISSLRAARLPHGSKRRPRDSTLQKPASIDCRHFPSRPHEYAWRRRSPFVVCVLLEPGRPQKRRPAPLLVQINQCSVPDFACPPPNSFAARCCISSGVSSSLRVAIAHLYPNGSLTWQ